MIRLCWHLAVPVLLSLLLASCAGKPSQELRFFAADDSLIQYTGRIDFSNTKLPRFWQPGVYIKARFEGDSCEVILKDEVLWGSSHNYIELVVDGEAKRLRTNAAQDTFRLRAAGAGPHELTICKNTEANIGYLELVGLRCEKLLPPLPRPSRKMEFIGNSITCGASSDTREIPCGKGVWQDQHNAWLSYGALTARSLDAEYHLSAVSGIGLMHSCCELDIIMPQVFDKISMRDNKIGWDFNRYQPDVVTVCLGQNDGIQDSTTFCNNYISFLQRLRGYYPKAAIVCLSSPMAHDELNAVLRSYVQSVVNKMNEQDPNIYRFFFSKRYWHGCDTHPDIAEHAEMATELSAFIKNTLKW